MIAHFHIFPPRLHSPASRPEKQRQRRAWLIASSSLSPLIPQVRTYVRTRARTTTCASAHVTKWAQGAQAAGAASGLDARAASARKRHWDTYRSNTSQDSTAMPRAQIRTHVRTHALPCQGCRSFTAMRRIQYVRTYARTISTADPRMQEFPPVPRPRQGCKRSTA